MARVKKTEKQPISVEPKTKTKKAELTNSVVEPSQKRTYLKQTDVPSTDLEEALRVPSAILEHYAGKPTSPIYVAKALNVDPKGSQLKVLTGAAIAFGLIEGGAQAAAITITELAKRILRPKEDGMDLIARRDAVLSPRIFKEFLNNYDNHPFPRTDIAQNVLEDMGVPRDKALEVLERIEISARSVGYLEKIKDKLYVILNKTDVPSNNPEPTASTEIGNLDHENGQYSSQEPANNYQAQPTLNNFKQSVLANAIVDDIRRRRVFITHGKNKELVEPIKKLLEYGELTPVVSVERQSVSKPVPEKVMDDMRGCGAAIIHVDADQTIIDNTGVEHILINPNVLIEIGAAMAFYGRRFILLVKQGVKLPSNLQGLYEVRYNNNSFDADATIRLLEAIKDIKNYSLPTDEGETE